MPSADEIIAAIAKVEDPAVRRQMMKDMMEAQTTADERKKANDEFLGGYSAVQPPPKEGLDYKFGPREPGTVSYAEAQAVERQQRERFRRHSKTVKRTPVE